MSITARHFFDTYRFPDSFSDGTGFTDFRDLISLVHDDLDLFFPEFMAVQCQEAGGR